jgi:hypothetical protein
MPSSELTPHDLEWLAQHAEASRLGCDFILNDVLRPNTPYAETAARIVPIWYMGGYVDASAVIAQIEKNLPSSQIFEQWEYRRYEDMIRACNRLSNFDSRVLLVASGLAYQDEKALWRSACESVEEAKNALYGEDTEDAFEDFEGKPEEQLSIWTVYAKPRDYPDQFVAIHGFADEVLLADSLDTLRSQMPAGLFRFPASAADDPVIVEVWL